MKDLEKQLANFKSEYRLKGSDINVAVLSESTLKVIGSFIPPLGAIHTVYADQRNERRFRRIEDAIRLLVPILESNQQRIIDINQHDQEELFYIFEQTLERIEKDSIARKKEYYVKFCANTFFNKVTSENYTEKKMFLDILESLTYEQIDFFNFILDKDIVSADKLKYSKLPFISIKYTLIQLNRFGLIDDISGIDGGSFDVSEDNTTTKEYKTSDIGKEFHKYCISDIDK